MRLLALSLTLVSCAVFAADPAAPADQAPKPDAPQAVAAAAPGAAASTPERKRVCKKETATGSSVAHTVCRDEQTPEEIAQGLDGLRNNLDRVIPTHH